MILAPGQPSGTSRSAWPSLPVAGEDAGGCPEEQRGNRVSLRRKLTPRRKFLLGICSPAAKPHSLPSHGEAEQSHPHHQQPTLYLCMALRHAAAANMSAKIPSQMVLERATCCLQHLPGYPQRSSQAAHALCRRAGRPARLAFIPPAAAKLPGWAAHARPASWGLDVRQRLTQSSPAMCTQPRPGKNPSSLVERSP